MADLTPKQNTKKQSKRAQKPAKASKSTAPDNSGAENGDTEPKKGAGGRPSKYKAEFVKQATKLCALGATDEEVAAFFEVNIATLYRWRHAHPEFCESLKSGKDAADERVERSLYMKAVGYKTDAVKIFMPAGAEEPVYAPYVENVQPDTTAAIFWLKNRRAETWRDKKDVDVTVIPHEDRLAIAKERASAERPTAH